MAGAVLLLLMLVDVFKFSAIDLASFVVSLHTKCGCREAVHI